MQWVILEKKVLYKCFQNIKSYTAICKVVKTQTEADFQKEKHIYKIPLPPPSLLISRPGEDAHDKNGYNPMCLDRQSKGL